MRSHNLELFLKSLKYTTYTVFQYIGEILLSTREELIVENAAQDYYWGCDADGSGKNRLGKILMKVRAKLRNL